MTVQNIDGNGHGAEDDDIDVRQLIGALYNHLWIVLLSFLIFLGVGIFFVLSIDPRFRSSTDIYVEDAGIRASVDPTDILSVTSPDEKVLQSEILVIRSNQIVSRVIDEMGLDADVEFNGALREPSLFDRIYYPVRERVVGTLEELTGKMSDRRVQEGVTEGERARYKVIETVTKALDVKIVDDSYVMRLSFAASSPQKAAEIATKFAETYIDERNRVRLASTSEAMDYLKERIPELKSELDDLEREITAFQSSSGVMEDRALALANAELARRVEQLERLKEKYAESIKLKADYADTFVNEVQARAILGKLLPESSDVEGADAIILAKRQLSDLDRWLERYEDQETQLTNAIESLRRRVQTQGAKTARLDQLTREAAATQAIYESFIVKLKEVSQQAAVQEKDVRIIANAEPPSQSFYPNRKLLAALFAAAGLGLGALLAIFKDFYSSPFRTADEFSSMMKTNVLASTPMVRRKISFGPEDVSKGKQFLQGSIRNLRSLLVINDTDTERTQTIAITSTVPGEGKTTTAVLLAQASVAAGESTLLIDCDLWRMRLTKDLIGDKNAERSEGVAQLLKEEARLFIEPDDSGVVQDLHEAPPASRSTVIQRCPGLEERIDLIPAGPGAMDSTQLLVSARFRKLIDELRRNYDCIIIDCPPMIAGSDAMVIGRQTDKILYLVRAGKAKRGIIRQHLHHIRSTFEEKCEVVMTGVKPRGRDYGYGYGYGSYGSYGYGAYGYGKAA